MGADSEATRQSILDAAREGIAGAARGREPTEGAVAAQREIGLRDQLIVSDRATMRFLVTARLEHHRSRQRHDAADAVVATVHGF